MERERVQSVCAPPHRRGRRAHAMHGMPQQAPRPPPARPPSHAPARLLDGLVQQAQLLRVRLRLAQRLLGDQAVDAGQEAVHALNALGGPHLCG